MASALVPLILDLAPSLIELITGLVHKAAPVAEASNGPKTGAVKFEQVFSTVSDALRKAAAVGTIPKELPSSDVLKLIIQSVVSSMQMGGILTSAQAAAIASNSFATSGVQVISIRAGQTITITGSN